MANSKAALTTVLPCGRDITNEEWRVLPEFPKYEITADGDIRHRETGRVLKEYQANNGGWFYTLYREDGTRGNRGTWKLINSAWPN